MQMSLTDRLATDQKVRPNRPNRSRPIRLAIVSTHPIQYNAPVFRALAAREDLDVKVFFGWQGTASQLDVEFGRAVTWDIPLTEGYDHTFVENVSRQPGTHRFMGLRNPDMVAQIESFEPDALLVYGWSNWTHLSVMRHFKGRVPIFFRGDSTLMSSDRRWKALLRRRVLTWVYRHVDHAIYVGQRNRDYFLSPAEAVEYGLIDRVVTDTGAAAASLAAPA